MSVNTPALIKTHRHPHAVRFTPAWGRYAPRGQPPVRDDPPHLCCAASTGMLSTGLRVSRLS